MGCKLLTKALRQEIVASSRRAWERGVVVYETALGAAKLGTARGIWSEKDVAWCQGGLGGSRGALVDGRKAMEEVRGPVWLWQELLREGLQLAGSCHHRAVCWQHEICQQAAIRAAAWSPEDHQRR